MRQLLLAAPARGVVLRVCAQTTGKQYYANVHTGYTTFDFPTAPADHSDAPGGLVQPELEPQTISAPAAANE